MSFANPSAWARTIRGRMTLWATGITFVICAALCTAVYAGMSLSLHREVDAFLAGEVDEFRTIALRHEGELPEIEHEIRAELGSRTRGDLTFRLLDHDGGLLLSSDPDDPLRHAWTPPPRDALQSAFFSTIVDPRDGTSIRTCSLQGALPGDHTHILQATYRLDQVEHSLAVFLRSALLALFGGAALAFIGGRFLAGRGLRPIAAMSDAARRIEANRLDQRLPRTGNRDELDQLAATINEMLDRIDRQVRQMQQFTADASHELRTPLAALRGHAEVALTHERSAEELREVLAAGLAEYIRLSRIAEDLLLLARLDAGGAVLHPTAMRLDRAAADVADLYAPLAAERGMTLRAERLEETWISGDTGCIRQIIGNLVDNAIKHAGDGADIELRVTSEPDVGVLTVRDNGVGIPREHLARVFDRFYRVDRSRQRNGESGAGLGLAICRSIAAASGGTLDIRSCCVADGSRRTGTTVTARFLRGPSAPEAPLSEAPVSD